MGFWSRFRKRPRLVVLQSPRSGEQLFGGLIVDSSDRVRVLRLASEDMAIERTPMRERRNR
jgi:hypothetical protein